MAKAIKSTRSSKTISQPKNFKVAVKELPDEKITIPKLKEKRRLPRIRLYNFGLLEEKNNFIENISLFLESGMDLISAIGALEEENRSIRMKSLLKTIREQIEDGSPFWQALEYTRAFNQQSISLIKIGEQSGRLSDNLKVVSLQNQKNSQFVSKVRSALIYPGFVLFIMVVVGTIMAWMVLPNLAKAFASFDVKLPLITRLLIDLGDYLGQYGIIIIPSVILTMLILIFFVFIFKPTKVIGQFILFHIPGVRKLMMQVELARLGFVLGTLLEAGMPLIFSIRSLLDSTTMYAYRKFYLLLINDLDQGNSIKKTFSSYKKTNKIIPFSIQQFIVAGERSGYLSKALLKIGVTYEEKIENSTKDLAVVIEPVLLFVVWIGVLVIALAVMLPIYSLSSAF